MVVGTAKRFERLGERQVTRKVKPGRHPPSQASESVAGNRVFNVEPRRIIVEREGIQLESPTI